MEERLQKVLARAGIGSRRKCEEFIKNGLVSVDGKIIKNMGHKVDPARTKIEFNNKPVEIKEEEKTYLLLYKPTGYVSTLSDPQGRPIISDLIPGKIKARLYPVGRLDLDSEGAVIMTNDGEITNKILHPRYGVHKTYHIIVDQIPDRNKLTRLEKGIIIDSQRTLPARIRLLKKRNRESEIEVVLHEGKKRQIRKMFMAIGHPVKKLKRVAYGRLSIGNLKPGEHRILTHSELKKVFL